MPPVEARFRCGDQVLSAEGARCGMIVLPKGPEGTIQMRMQAAGTDTDVVVMALAVVEYVRSLGLGPALIRCLEEEDLSEGNISVVRADQYEEPPTPQEEG